ncbi:MAG: glycosyltransferase family 39 protein [Candidatus Eisenbacteria bacterium]
MPGVVPRTSSERTARPSSGGGSSAGDSRRAFALLFLLTLLVRLPFLFEAMINWDESTFLLMGADILRGHLPYEHAWDNKPPLAFVPFAVVLAIFGKNVVGSRILGILLVSASAWILRRAAGRIVGSGAAMWAAVLLVLFAGAPPGVFATMTEHLALPLLCLVLDRLLSREDAHRRILGTGILLGLAVLVRTNAAYACLGAAAGLWVLSPKRIVPRTAVLAAGCLLPALVAGIVYAGAGRLDLLVRSVIDAPLAYGSSGWLLRPEAIRRTAEYALRPEILLSVLAFAGGVLLLVRDAREGRVPGRPLAALAVFLLSLLLSMIGSGRLFGHYLIQVLPFVAIAAGRLFDRIAASSLRLVLFAGLFVPAYPSLVQYGKLASRVAETGTVFSGRVYSAAEYLREERVAGETLFFPEHQILYLLTETKIPTRFVHPSLLINEPILKTIEGPGASTRSEILSIFGKGPRFVVKSEKIWYLRRFPEAEELIDGILARDYRLVEEIESLRIYERRTDEDRVERRPMGPVGQSPVDRLE